MKLLTSQKNVLFDILMENDFNPSLFSYEDTNGDLKISLKNSEFYFSITHYIGSEYQYIFQFSPGENEYYGKDEYVSFYFDGIKELFSNWCGFLKRELSFENKWTRLDQEIKSANISFESESDKFSFAEYQEVKIKVEVLKEQIKAIPLEPEQFNAINNKLDHLIIQAETLSKFDWKSMFVGTMISIIIQLSVSPANAKELWTLIKQVFSGYFLN